MAEGRGPRRLLLAALFVGAFALIAAALVTGGSGVRREYAVGLFTSLPILWRETESLGEQLDGEARPHWAAAIISAEGAIRPLDALVGPDGKLPLDQHSLLLIAQPRPLAPQENVALDNWVRRGGRVLLFADPMLTAPSIFALGDKRRPQDIALLSPILARWGLKLQFDESQPAGERSVALLGAMMPVNLSGRFGLRRGTRCELLAHALAARCRVGRGEVLAVADAALLESGTSGDEANRVSMLRRLLRGIGR